MKDRVIILEANDTLHVKINGDIDHHSSTELRSQIDSRLFSVRPKILILDFESVRFMDSSGIGLIMGRVEKARMEGAEVRLVGLSKSIRKLVLLSGLNKIDGLRI